MALETTTNRQTYAGNGSTTAFSFPYYFLSGSDLVVIIRNNSTGVETTKTITTHYTVTGAGNEAGGTVTMVTAPASGETLIIYRDPSIIQDKDFRENDSFPAEQAEEAYDRAAMVSQRLKDRVDRTVRLSDGFSPTFDPTLPTTLNSAGSKVPLINSGGTGWAATADWPTATAINTAQTSATNAAASATDAGEHKTTASRWATKTDGSVVDADTGVDSGDHSAKAYAIGGTGVTSTAGKGAAKEWAAKTSANVDGTDFSAKEYAQGTQASTGGSSKNWAQQTGADVTGAAANSRSAKSWAQDANTGATLGGSAKDWAQNTSVPVDGASGYSAKEHAQGTQTRGAAGGGSAKDWATYTGGTVDNAEYSAKKYAQDAAAAVASAFFRDVVYKTSADSPVSITSADNGKVFVFDSSGGAITVNLPQISGLTPPFNIAFLLKTAGNTVTINRAGTDTIMGATSKAISAAGVGFQLAADTDGTPDDWTALDFGAVADGSVTIGKLDSTTTTGPGILLNGTLVASVASNALTVAVKTLAGSDPSASDPVTVFFRNATAATGNYVRRQITSALSLTISSGSTLGHSSGGAHYIYAYLIDSGSGVVLGLSSSLFDEGTVQSSTAEGGAGAADSGRLIYTAAAQTSKPILLIGRLKSTQTTAGTWAATMSEIALWPFQPRQQILHAGGSTTSIANNTATEMIFSTKVFDPDNIYDTSTGRATVKRTGKYLGIAGVNITGTWGSANNSVQLNFAIGGAGEYAAQLSPVAVTADVSRGVKAVGILDLTAGNEVSVFCTQASGGSKSSTNNTQYTFMQLYYLGE